MNFRRQILEASRAQPSNLSWHGAGIVNNARSQLSDGRPISEIGTARDHATEMQSQLGYRKEELE